MTSTSNTHANLTLLPTLPATLDLSKYTLPQEALDRLRPMSEYSSGVIDRFEHPSKFMGKSFPWSKLSGLFGVRPHEVTVYSGYNGSGKSLILNQIMLHAAKQGERCVIVSPEMAADVTSFRMTKQALAGCGYNVGRARQFIQWTYNKIWIYDHLGKVDWRRVLALARYCAAELKITQIALDSLMKFGINSDDYNTQKQFLDELTVVCRDTGLHIHLVAHARKAASEDVRSAKMDIKGASEITDLADNVWTVWRNKPKEDEAGKESPDPAKLAAPDALFQCTKQRHGDGWEGKIGLDYDPASMSFVEPGTTPKPWNEI